MSKSISIQILHSNLNFYFSVSKIQNNISYRKSGFEGHSTQANSNPILHFPKNLLHISNIQNVPSTIQIVKIQNFR